MDVVKGRMRVSGVQPAAGGAKEYVQLDGGVQVSVQEQVSITPMARLTLTIEDPAAGGFFKTGDTVEISFAKV